MSQNRPPNRPPHSKPGNKPARPNERGGDKPRGGVPKPFGERSSERSGERPKFDGPKLTLPGGARPQAQGERSNQERPQRERNPHDRAPQNREHGSRGQRPPAVPNGAVWLYGLHAVAAALGNPARRLRRLVITEEAQATLAAERPLPWAVQPEIAPRDKIDQLLGARPGSGIVHQGVALLTDQLATPALLDALARPGPILVLDQISDPRNIGALMRTAQAFGAAMVIAQERNAPEETGALAKVASGALELIPLLRIVNISRALIVLKSANVWVVGLDGTSPTQLNGQAFAGRRVALVLGNEGEGMRRLTRETCDEIAALAMPGGMESLNVSAAGAVALYELTRS
ncbi:MAG: TrmH family RNA methyltransferase [Acidocella sp.]|nr:TrmH family RNA methyltransferase [Acidocella sp.]